ncbi:uncharacterized protein VTP21DRAFT_6385 [Calcarisporiella thermophila]|uniref:uncharacterized protein n=1 Tax=Calcarisporiella thermophila TaxID=911321 RepID=UPI003741FD09
MTVDYGEEQRQEIEILQSIYPDELEQLDSKSIRIRVEPDEQIAEDTLALGLVVNFTSTYPEELPALSLEILEGKLSQEHIEKLESQLLETAENSLGMAMVFTLASQLKELLTTLVEQIRADREREAEERAQRELELEQAKFQGTRVTVQSFLEWKERFDREMAELEAKESKGKEEKKKLTGRQLFEQDRNLAASDMAIMDEGVAVDASLFEHEDLEDDEEEENEVLNSIRGTD